MLSAPADTMRAPPGSQTQGEVHLTDNPADLDVITGGPGTRGGKTNTHKHNRRLLGNATPTASDDRGRGGDTALPFASLL